MATLAACDVYLGDTAKLTQVDTLMTAITTGSREAYVSAIGNPARPGSTGETRSGATTSRRPPTGTPPTRMTRELVRHQPGLLR